MCLFTKIEFLLIQLCLFLQVSKMNRDKNNRSFMERSGDDDADDSDDASNTVRKKASACCVSFPG